MRGMGNFSYKHSHFIALLLFSFRKFALKQDSSINIMPMKGTDEILFKRAEKAILQHELYLRDNMSRGVLDKYVHIPKNKFAPIFRKYTGCSFPQYINGLRLERASKMLVDFPKHTIESIATDCGMPVAQTFYRLFREKFGMTPTAYRNKYTG